MESRLRPFGLLFERSLNALIKGIRSRKETGEVESYLARVISECREEVRSADFDIKAMAILKLAYLEMYGYDMSWAGFHVLEVMSSPKFQQKRVGYLAAMQSFRADPELLMLTTNLLKNDLTSPHQRQVGIALSGLASIVSPLLAADLYEDLAKMLTHSNAYVRKKAVLTLYKVILQYPDALPLVSNSIRDKLDDESSSVVSAAVNVVCELSYKSEDPSHFIEFSPQLFELLTESDDNWMKIKILKLFSLFTLHEPRLITKIRDHIVTVIQTTPAKSLLYEGISAVLRGKMIEEDDFRLSRVLVDKLRDLLEESDPNLKYVALTALSQLAKLNPDFLAGEHVLVMSCIDYEDVSLRVKVLNMLSAIINDDNIEDIVAKLIEQLEAPTSVSMDARYKEQLVNAIVGACKMNNYANLPNFEWYTDILLEMALLTYQYVPETARIVGSQLQDIAVRVKSVRSTVVKACYQLALDAAFVAKQPEILDYCMWVIGEYIADYTVSSNTLPILERLLNLPCRPVSVVAITKLFARYASSLSMWSESVAEHTVDTVERILEMLEQQSANADFVIQERAVEFGELFKLALDAVKDHSAEQDSPPALLTIGFPSLFSLYEFTPVAKSAQGRIPLPTDLDLDTPVDLPPIDFVSDSESESDFGSEPEPEPETQTPEPRYDPEKEVFYIKPSQAASLRSGTSTPVIAESAESSAVVSERASPRASPAPLVGGSQKKSRRAVRVKVEIAQDESIDGVDEPEPSVAAKKPLLAQPSPKFEEKVDDVVVKRKKVKKKRPRKPESEY